MHELHRITSPCFHAWTQLSQLGEHAGSSPELLHQRMRGLIDEATAGARRIGLDTRDVDDMTYGLVAATDEFALLREGALRDFWLPRMLQLQYFNENLAGENFFKRLQAIRESPERLPLLRLYYQILLFGFRGKYRVRGGELDATNLIDSIGGELRHRGELPSDIVLSPHGARPYEPTADARRNSVLLWLSVGAAVASVLLYAGLKLSLASDASRLGEMLSSFGAG